MATAHFKVVTADKPSTFAPIIGTGANQAAAGNHTHTASTVTATAVGEGTATDVQGVLEELEARITALEALQG